MSHIDAIARIAKKKGASSDITGWVAANRVEAQVVSTIASTYFWLNHALAGGIAPFVRSRVHVLGKQDQLWPLVQSSQNTWVQASHDVSFKDISDVQSLLLWRLARWEEEAKGITNPSPPARPSLRSHFLLDSIQDVVDFWPTEGFLAANRSPPLTKDFSRVHVYYDVELTLQAMFNAILAGNPDAGGSLDDQLPPGEP